MRIKAPFQIKRARFAEKVDEIAFVLTAWVHGAPRINTEDHFRRGHSGVMMFLGGRAIYHGYGGFNRDGTFVKWGRPWKSRFA
jgi:hypothetical protein